MGRGIAVHRSIDKGGAIGADRREPAPSSVAPTGRIDGQAWGGLLGWPQWLSGGYRTRAASIASQIGAGRASATVHIGAIAFLGVTIMVSGIPGLQYADAAVTAVMPDSRAAAAGLTVGDVITRLGTHPIASASAVESVIGQYYPDQRISIGWLDRADQPRTATVMLTSGPVG